jgi:hypothetical protein
VASQLRGSSTRSNIAGVSPHSLRQTCGLPPWFEEYWLTEARPAPSSVTRRYLARLTALPGVLVKLRRLIAERSTEHMLVPEAHDAH